MMRLLSLIALVFLATSRPVMANCVCVTCLFTAYENFIAMSGSMEPTMPTGRCFKARHIDPSTHALRRGEVIVFRHPERDDRFVFRLIALAGDYVQMRDGRVVLNGNEVSQAREDNYEIIMEHQGPKGLLPRCPAATGLGETCTILRFRETMPNGTSYSVLNLGDFPMDNTGMFHVPDDMVFVLGDNRDNASDSRIPLSVGGMGFVPRDNIVGVFEDVNPRD